MSVLGLVGAVLAAILLTGAPIGQPMTLYISSQDLFKPQTVAEILAVLGAQVDGPEKALPKGASLMGILGPSGAGKTTTLSRSGFEPGDKIKITNVDNKMLRIERVTPGNTLIIQVEYQNVYRPEAVRQAAANLALQPQGWITWLPKGDSFTAIIGPNGSGKTTLLFDRGYNTNDKVKCTNFGGGKMKIERLKPGMPLTMYLQIQDYIKPGLKR